MSYNAPRSAPHAKIKVLSLAYVLSGLNRSITVGELSEFGIGTSGFTIRNKTVVEALQDRSFDLFHTVGTAEELRIDEQWGTQLIYEIGSPTRPAIVPNNYSVNISISTITLNGKSPFEFITSPDYWYSPVIHRLTGTYDYAFYTYLAVKEVSPFFDADKAEEARSSNYDIYAVMPVSASTPISTGQAKIVQNVSMTGYKISYAELVNQIVDDIQGNSV